MLCGEARECVKIPLEACKRIPFFDTLLKSGMTEVGELALEIDPSTLKLLIAILTLRNPSKTEIYRKIEDILAQCGGDHSRVKPFQQQPVAVKSKLVRRAITALCIEKVQAALNQFSSDGKDARKKLMVLADQLRLSEIVILLNKLERYEGKRLQHEVSRPVADYDQHISISKGCQTEDMFDDFQRTISHEIDTAKLGYTFEHYAGLDIGDIGRVPATNTGKHEQTLSLDLTVAHESEPPLRRQKCENL